MTGMIFILIFAVLILLPVSYITIRKLFTKMSKRKVFWIALGITAVAVTLLALSFTAGTPPADTNALQTAAL